MQEFGGGPRNTATSPQNLRNTITTTIPKIGTLCNHQRRCHRRHWNWWTRQPANLFRPWTTLSQTSCVFILRAAVHLREMYPKTNKWCHRPVVLWKTSGEWLFWNFRWIVNRWRSQNMTCANKWLQRPLLGHTSGKPILKNKKQISLNPPTNKRCHHFRRHL